MHLDGWEDNSHAGAAVSSCDFKITDANGNHSDSIEAIEHSTFHDLNACCEKAKNS